MELSRIERELKAREDEFDALTCEKCDAVGLDYIYEPGVSYGKCRVCGATQRVGEQ